MIRLNHLCTVVQSTAHPALDVDMALWRYQEQDENGLCAYYNPQALLKSITAHLPHATYAVWCDAFDTNPRGWCVVIESYNSLYEDALEYELGEMLNSDTAYCRPAKQLGGMWVYVVYVDYERQ